MAPGDGPKIFPEDPLTVTETFHDQILFSFPSLSVSSRLRKIEI